MPIRINLSLLVCLLSISRTGCALFRSDSVLSQQFPDTCVHDDVPLSEYPMIMPHDAGSGYLKPSLINKWVATQNGSLVNQLECGARAFDARPYLDETQGLVWHHGGVVVNHSFAASVLEVVEWCGAHPDELVLLLIWDCAGGVDCFETVEAKLFDVGVHILKDCSMLSEMSVGQARQHGKLWNGGSLLAVTGAGKPDGVACAHGHYHSQNSCSGFETKVPWALDGNCFMNGITPETPIESLSEAQLATFIACTHTATKGPLAAGADTSHMDIYQCYHSDPSSGFPRKRLFDHLDNVSSRGPPRDKMLWQMQALWQETAGSVFLGILAGSSLIADESRSRLNTEIVNAVAAGQWAHINLLEVNNVCDEGPVLFNVLRQWLCNSTQNQKSIWW